MASNAKSNFLEQKFIDHVLRNTSYTSPTTVYVALFTALSDGEAGTYTEVSNSGTAYTRQTATFGAGSQVGGAFEVSNSSDITFSEATGNWGTVTHFAIFDSSTYGGGNLLYYSPLDTSKAINTGDTARFVSGTLKVNEA